MKRISETYSERIFSRITENFTILRLYGEDIRIQKKLEGIWCGVWKHRIYVVVWYRNIQRHMQILKLYTYFKTLLINILI